jgi:hypothetical protein
MSKIKPGRIISRRYGKRAKQAAIRCEPRWRAASPTLMADLEKFTRLMEAHEPRRQRRRRANDAATFRLAIESIACNLLAVSIGAPDRALAVPLSNSASQIAPVFGKPARKVIDVMVDLKLVSKVRGYPGPTRGRTLQDDS